VPTSNGLAGLRFAGAWRRYQELALEAFERDREAGRRHTHIVAPPGSGKTLLGVELARRIGAPCLVLAPNSAIQAQWLVAVRAFGAGEDVARAEPGAPISCLTYQSLAQVEDPGAALSEMAATRWAVERAAATGQTPEEAAAEGVAWTGEAARRRARELARIVAALKREIARGEHAQGLGDLLSAGARARIEALRAAGTATVVLDECHHLASLWGYVVRAVVEELGDVHLIGLTATPPDELTAVEADLYAELLGPVDFEIPTPAVVREGFLAPYQELAWLTTPLDSELRWLAEHDLRFQELITSLHDEDPALPVSFPGWVIARLRYRDRGEGDAEVPWEAFQRRRPALARAGVRFLASAGLALPAGAPHGEGYRRPPDLDDWLELLEDYALRGLRADPSPAAAARYDAIAAALRELGYSLTRQGIRRGASDVDRVLAASAAKPIALVEVLACEMEARGDALRALVLADSERAELRADSELRGVLPDEAGTAVAALRALAADVRTAPLRPLLVSGRGVRCVSEDAGHLAAALGDGVRVEPDGDGLARLVRDGADWRPLVWVRLATEALRTGATETLVGTRALLGEGWDAPCVNCLVDLTIATTGVSVRQMRGRSLRLDPQDAEKIASNWDVVCVAPALARGAGDYTRFVRKHRHLYAPCEDGTIEAGPSHVHPALGPFGPPEEAELGGIDAAMRVRAADHLEARERWRIGEPYEGAALSSVVVRARRRPPGPGAGSPDEAAYEAGGELGEGGPPRIAVSRRGPLGAGGAVALASLGAVALAGPLALAGVVALPVAAVWAAARLRHAARELPPAAPLDRVVRAVAEAYVETGDLRTQAAQSLRIEPRADGFLRCVLHEATPEESARFATGLETVLQPPAAPRYLVSRLVADPDAGSLVRLLRRHPFSHTWHAVPDDLGSHKVRAEAFHRAWTRWLGPSELLFTQRSEEGRTARAQAASQDGDYDTQLRDVWV
jgi:superfamily II DNA or RNA helicase